MKKAVLASLLLLALSNQGRGKTVGPPVGEKLGIACYFPLGADPASTQARELDLDAIKAAGFHFFRTDFLWSTIEPARGTFDFSGYDRLVSAATARGLSVLAELDYGNPWSNALGSEYAPPDDPGDYALYVGATVGHYKGAVDAFEVWNEPNAGLRFWKPTIGGDAQGYAQLLAAAYQAAKAANPTCEVSTAGSFFPEVPLVIPGTLAFTEELYAARPDLGKIYDAFAYHAYRYPFVAPELPGWFPNLPGMEPNDEMLSEVRAELASHGCGGKPVWITEVGWHTAPWSYPFVGVSERDQARFLVRAAVPALAAGVERFVWYELDDGPLEQLWQEDAFGILDYAKNPKLAFFASQTLAAEIGGAGAGHDVAAALGLPSSARAFAFGDVTVLWTVSGTLGLALAVPPGAQATLTTLEGVSSPLASQGGKVAVTLSEDPIYVRIH